MHKVSFIVLFCLLMSGRGVADRPPNFVIFYVDDLGWADTSVAMLDGEPRSKSDFYVTPALERLARRGMRFSNGYAPTPTCTGSRISIQFGKTPARLQYRNVFDVLAKQQRPEGWDDETSMAQVLKDSRREYITAHFGKGMSVRRMDDAGYDVTDEYDKGPNGNAHGAYIDVKTKTPIPDENPKRIVDLTDRSIAFVREHAGHRPFFLMVSHYAVHVPHQASPEVIQRCRQRWIDLGHPDVGPDDPGYKKAYSEWLYAAMIEQTDASLGAILDALQQCGASEQTYVVFTSDNGGGHGTRDASGNRFNGPLQEGKRSVFEGGLRVPFVVAGPGIPPGTQCDVPVIQWDLLPTLHELSASTTPLPPGIDGGSLADVFKRANEGSVTRNAPGLVFHYTCHYHPPISAIRIGDYKMMRHLNTGQRKLFNVAADYAEQHDLAERMPQKVEQMDRIRQRYIDRVNGGTMPQVYAAYFDWLDETLRKKEERIEREIKAIGADRTPSAVQRLESLHAERLKARNDHASKYAICKDQMTNPSWRESTK